jgi:hypothetical protein
MVAGCEGAAREIPPTPRAAHPRLSNGRWLGGGAGLPYCSALTRGLGVAKPGEARFDPATFPNSEVRAVHKAPGDFPGGKQGDVLTVEFTVVGIPCLGLNGDVAAIEVARRG